MFGARVFNDNGDLILDSDRRGLGLHATGTLTSTNTGNHIATITYPSAPGAILLFKPPVTARYMTVGSVQNTFTRFLIEAGSDDFVMPWMILSPGVVANAAQFGIRTYTAAGQLSFSTEQIVPGVKGLTAVSWLSQMTNWNSAIEVDDILPGATLDDWVLYPQPGMMVYILQPNQNNAFDVRGAYGRIRRLSADAIRKRIRLLDIAVIPANAQAFPFNSIGCDQLGLQRNPPFNFYALGSARQQNVVVFAGP